MKPTFVVVGGGQAGGQAIQTLLKEGFDGHVVLVAEEDQLPYERPALSKEVLLHGEKGRGEVLMVPQQFYLERGVELRLGTRVVAIDRERHRVVMAGKGINYDKLLLATGSRPKALSIPGATLNGVFVLRTIDQSLALHKCLRKDARVVIVGGGFIGLEVAATARERQCHVTVLEMHPALLQRVVAPHIGRLYEELHRSNGVEVRTGAVAVGFLGDRRVERVICSDGTMIAADVVLVGVGVAPNVELAQEAGLETDNGIVVDEYGQTSDPSIFAAGDVTNHPNPYVGRRIRLESWENARNQGVSAARAMCGHRTPYAEVPWFWSDQYGVNMQMLGVPDRWERVVIRGSVDRMKFSAFYLEHGTIVGANMVNNGSEVRAVRQLMREKRQIDPDVLADQGVAFKQMPSRVA